MDPHTLAGSDTAVASRLLIHAACDPTAAGWSVGSLIQRIRAHGLTPPRDERSRLALEIHDLCGHRVLALADARPWVDVALPPGTYHVTTQLGGTRRRYTITLEQGASFELRLRHREGAP